jgi:hypothetical protein
MTLIQTACLSVGFSFGDCVPIQTVVISTSRRLKTLQIVRSFDRLGALQAHAVQSGTTYHLRRLRRRGSGLMIQKKRRMKTKFFERPGRIHPL